uniref:Uncharacterized protein n=1 Tax=Vespula pensylvanica TaxID=30213 RepID=A0A834PJX2_VESPE|nr:hypothetical protein H0235_001932 [Vespula pensylvanica]
MDRIIFRTLSEHYPLVPGAENRYKLTDTKRTRLVSRSCLTAYVANLQRRTWYVSGNGRKELRESCQTTSATTHITMAFSLLPRRIENEYGDFLDVVVASTVLIVVVVAFAAVAAVVATSLSMSVQLGTINAC